MDEPYEKPAVIATYSVDELRKGAATAATSVPSDLVLKDEVEVVERPLARLRRIRTK
jgi:hypothetical protein